MFPRITITLLVVIVAAYIVGARWPMLAQRVGAA